ncbi:hypothetical protein [Paenibacillus sp. MBLB4367]|uniref:hypothetical protein n=1 Tax=Paenibacillus sp. MBLB4367 TaxID=3384767 RepID=UPI0039082848
MSIRAKLSQNTAILLERARRFGIADEVLLAGVSSGDTGPLQAAAAQYYSYDEFYTYAETHGEQLADAIRSGYRMKFNTPGGVQLWLKERLGLEAGADFQTPVTGKVEGLLLSNAQADLLRETLAVNWVMLEAEAGGEAAERKDGDQAAAPPSIQSGSGLRAVTLIIGSLYEAH